MAKYKGVSPLAQKRKAKIASLPINQGAKPAESAERKDEVAPKNEEASSVELEHLDEAELQYLNQLSAEKNAVDNKFESFRVFLVNRHKLTEFDAIDTYGNIHRGMFAKKAAEDKPSEDKPIGQVDREAPLEAPKE